MVYQNETASVLPLQGKVKEAGIYKCRWKNKRGEDRHRNFTVSISFFEESSDISIITVSVTLIGLLVVGTGIGIKVYRDKVRNKNKKNKKTHIKYI